MHLENPKFEEFSTALRKNGAVWPEPFVQTLDRLIISSHPKYTKKAAKLKEKAMNGATATKDKDGAMLPPAVTTAETERRARMFPGIAKPDQEWQPIEAFLGAPAPGSKEEAEEKARSMHAKSVINIDDEMAKLAALAPTNRRPAAADFLDDGPAAKRQRHDGRDNGYAGRDNGYAGRGAGGPSNGGGYGYHAQESRGRTGRPGLDDRPVLYKIYPATITGIREFGAFASLEGIQGRVEGRSGIGGASSP